MYPTHYSYESKPTDLFGYNNNWLRIILDLQIFESRTDLLNILEILTVERQSGVRYCAAEGSTSEKNKM